MTIRRHMAHIDLSTGHVDTRAVPSGLRRLFVGGRGLGTRLIYDRIVPGGDPLHPESATVIGTGPLCGTLASPSGFAYLTAALPRTRCVATAITGGLFPRELRLAGFDHVLIRGRAPRPSYLWIVDGEITVRDGTALMGLGTMDILRALRHELGDEVRALCVGSGGERLDPAAHGGLCREHLRGETGLGAVLDSKHLKAIACRGTLDIELKHPDEALAYDRALTGDRATPREGDHNLPGRHGHPGNGCGPCTARGNGCLDTAPETAARDREAEASSGWAAGPAPEARGRVGLWRRVNEAAAGCVGVCEHRRVFVSPDDTTSPEFDTLIRLNTGLKLHGEELWHCALRTLVVERLCTLRLRGACGEAPPPSPGTAAHSFGDVLVPGSWDGDTAPDPTLLKRLDIAALWPRGE